MLTLKLLPWPLCWSFYSISSILSIAVSYQSSSWVFICNSLNVLFFKFSSFIFSLHVIFRLWVIFTYLSVISQCCALDSRISIFIPDLFSGWNIHKLSHLSKCFWGCLIKNSKMGSILELIIFHLELQQHPICIPDWVIAFLPNYFPMINRVNCSNVNWVSWSILTALSLK